MVDWSGRAERFAATMLAGLASGLVAHMHAGHSSVLTGFLVFSAVVSALISLQIRVADSLG